MSTFDVMKCNCIRSPNTHSQIWVCDLNNISGDDCFVGYFILLFDSFPHEGVHSPTLCLSVDDNAMDLSTDNYLVNIYLLTVPVINTLKRQ